MDKMCAICGISLLLDEAITTCESCKSDFHAECWEENGGCATYGCEFAPKIEKDQNEQFMERTYWGAETKICPACGETIKVSEVNCPYCKEKFDTEKPITSEEFKGKFSKKSVQVKEKKGAVIIFICGLLGITAPLNLLFGGIWYKENKQKLKEASPTYNLLAIVGLSVSVAYSLLIFFGIFLG